MNVPIIGIPNGTVNSNGSARLSHAFIASRMIASQTALSPRLSMPTGHNPTIIWITAQASAVWTTHTANTPIA